MLAEDMILLTKTVFAEFGLPKKFISDAGTNFVSKQFKEFSRHLKRPGHNIIISPQGQWMGGGMFIKFMTCTIKKCRQNHNDVNFALLEIRSTSLGAGMPVQLHCCSTGPLGCC